jgi:hypothetical protein
MDRADQAPAPHPGPVYSVADEPGNAARVYGLAGTLPVIDNTPLTGSPMHLCLIDSIGYTANVGTSTGTLPQAP